MAPKVDVPVPLSAQDKFSFAYKTMKDRLPVILVKTIDFFHRQRKELHKFGNIIDHEPNSIELAQIEEDAKAIIAEIARLRKELETNKSVSLFEKIQLDEQHQYFNDDVEDWNKALEANKLDDGSLPRWFDSAWLLVECYLYRRLKDISLRTKYLKMFDLFIEVKQDAAKGVVSQMKIIADHLCDVEKVIRESTRGLHPSERSEFTIFMQLSLWANKSDLSISSLSTDKPKNQIENNSIRESLENLQENILCDNLSDVWFKFQSIRDQVTDKLNKATETSKQESLVYIDIVADNSGYELFVDLCLIHFLSLLLSTAKDNQLLKFRIHLKRMPWFVSDCMESDLHWLLDYLESTEIPNLQCLSKAWKSFLASGHWEIHSHRFWTLPNDYADMKSIAGDLYSALEKSSFIIFKGDLNYRKLTGDRKWHILTPFRGALRGFGPAPLVSLRTAKADVVVGIEDVNIFARINNNELPRDWMISGDYGLIQCDM